MKILICEDEEIMLTALEFRLRKNGFEVLLAKNGKEALDMIKNDPPDLLVADIMMPQITGLELIDIIRNKMKMALPVIIISALEDEGIVLDAFQLGATDFVVKPFKPNELVLRIKRIFQAEAVG